MEIIVDAYDMEEREMGWFYYLDDKITFPFTAECYITDSRSPLLLGEQVVVSGMVYKDDWQSQDMYVEISWNNRTLSVPLAQLKPLSTDDETLEAVEDWHYWKRRGYEF
jgi:hypothetical protein